MQREEADTTPAEEWLQSLNATCNRLSTQYLNLLRAASSVSALEQGRQHDPRGKFETLFVLGAAFFLIKSGINKVP